MRQIAVNLMPDGTYTVKFEGLKIEEVVDSFKEHINRGTVDRDSFVQGVQLELADDAFTASPLQQLYDKARVQSGQISLEDSIAEVEAEKAQQ